MKFGGWLGMRVDEISRECGEKSGVEDIIK